MDGIYHAIRRKVYNKNIMIHPIALLISNKGRYSAQGKQKYMLYNIHVI